MKRNCQFCDTPLPAGSHGNKFYCDGNCRFKAYKAGNPNRPYFQRLRATSEERSCVVCGAEFVAERKDRRCCSPKCSEKNFRDENRRIITEAKDRPCEDCGLRWPSYVMHFHHVEREDKSFRVSTGPSKSRKRLIAEIAKCVVLCANCHAIRHKGSFTD